MASLSRAGPLVLVAAVAVAVAAEASLELEEIVAALVEVGPRLPGSAAHRAAAASLLARMEAVGLEKASVVENGQGEGWRHLRGVLPGRVPESIVLSAHYDTVEESQGAADNASGCAVALGAASTLSRTPRSRTVETILFDGEEMQAAGSSDWLESQPEDRVGSILANLNLEVLGRTDAERGVLALVGVRTDQGWSVTPAWLVHAIVEAAKSQDFPLAVADRYWSWFAQLAARYTRSNRISDADSFQRRGVPAVVLTDGVWSDQQPSLHTSSDVSQGVSGQRLERWVAVVTAAVRRLDALAGKPANETEYLVTMGRVWVRRNLVWIGFGSWIMMVWRGLPGGWRGVAADQRRRRGRAYLPGFAFRMLLLVAVFLVPTVTVVLLVPAVVIGFGASFVAQRMRRWLLLLANLPALAFALWLLSGQLRGWFVLQPRILLPSLLVLAVLGSLSVWLLDDRTVVWRS